MPAPSVRPPHVDGSARCLNGWWDFLPATDSDPSTAGTPGRDAPWAEGAYLVPSIWTKSPEGCREPGERQFVMRKDPEPGSGEASPFGDATEYLFDAYDYPVVWARCRSGWVRRRFEAHPAPGKRYFLRFEGILAGGRVFVNGVELGRQDDPMLPGEWDATDHLRDGANELLVFVTDYARSVETPRKTLWPSGNKFTYQHRGIWQDVWLRERPAVRVADVTVRPSTRRGELSWAVELANDSAEDFSGEWSADAVRWTGGDAEAAWAAVSEKSFPAVAFSLAAGERTIIRDVAPWPEAAWWTPESPALYWFRSRLLGGGGVEVDWQAERFGFREVWIEGPDLMLNDHPVHLFSDWGHKVTPYHHTEAWIRQWFGMIRAVNGNHSRLHTHPHPRLYLDLADEAGILITGETALHGSGGCQAADEPAYWENAREHVRRFIARDKNHPCIVLWSCENEMRHNRDRTPLTWEELPRLRAHIEELDPTRPVYHDGDSGLWDEGRQPAISRHYGKICAGWGWWDRSRPLFASEMAVYHYAAPGIVFQLGGDAVYADYDALCEAAGRDTEWIVEAGRVKGVAYFGPWNLSCLMNHRRTPERVTLYHADWEAPGVKPLAVPAYASEFAFWEDGPGYYPSAALGPQAQGFRPFAVIDLSRSGYALAGRTLRRTLHLVNDTGRARQGELRWMLCQGDQSLVEQRYPVEVPPGRCAEVACEVVLSPEWAGQRLTYRAEFREDGGEVLDAWERPLELRADLFAEGKRLSDPAAPRWAVYGAPGTGIEAALDAAGRPWWRVETVADLDPGATPRLLIDRGAVRSGTALNREVAAFLEKGGRVLLLEQTVSLFPSLKLEPMPCQLAWKTAGDEHPLTGSCAEDLFRFWGDAPYVDEKGDNLVADRLYEKDGLEAMHPLLEGQPAESKKHDRPDWTPLFETRVGPGLLLACQLRVGEKLPERAEAQAVWLALLKRLEAAEGSAEAADEAAFGECAGTAGMDDAVARARSGETVLVGPLVADEIPAWGGALGLDLRPAAEEPRYQGVRVGRPAALSGVSNADLCGVLRRNYGLDRPVTRLNASALQAMPGLEPWVVAPTRSLLRELFVEGGLTEPLRAPTASRFLFEDRPEEAVWIGRVRVGNGCVVFNQFAPEEGSGTERLRRVGARLRANLGHCYRDGRLLAGDAVPTPEAAASPGYPQWTYLLSEGVSEAVLQDLAGMTKSQHDKVANTVHLRRFPFARRETPDGRVAPEAPALVLCNHLRSPVERQTSGQELGLPDPKALTFLELRGHGRVRLLLNGEDRGERSFFEGRLEYGELPLVADVNWVLLVWWPDATGPEAAPLRMRWKDFDGVAETSFDFE